ncbi:MAG: hypothetical protein IK122_03290, partial [Alphaproteobacteria bacterium]|nr:hypothetical protein [Alphaproteobacteria bacterium]
SQTSGRTVNITAKSNIPYEITKVELAFLVPDADPVAATYAGNGTWWALHTFADSGRFEVSASVAGVGNVTVNNATIICKPDSTLILDNFALDYGQSRNVTVQTEGATGIRAWINGVEVPTGKYSVWIEGLPAGNSTLTVATIPDDDHGSVNKTVSITVHKVNSTLEVADIVFNYTGSGSGHVDFNGATGINAIVIGQPNAVVETTANEITVSGLGAGNYILSVTTIADGNHTSVTKNASITVNRIAPEIRIINETIDLKATEPVKLDGLADLIPGDIGKLTFTSSDVAILAIEDGYAFGRDIGTVAIIVSFAGNENYTAAENKTIKVNVIFENAGISVENSTLDLKAGDTFKLNATTNPGWLNVKYKSSDDSVATVDENGKPVSGVAVTVDLNGAKTYTTDKNGQIRVSTNALVPKAYTAKVTFNGNNKYLNSTTAVKVTVKKATPKLKAKKKTFKRSVKVKKYSIVLKTNTGKAMKKVKVRLKIKGKKAITVKTNSKGKATFKIKKLTKKGKYKATVTFKANKYYNKVAKKVIIKIK